MGSGSTAWGDEYFTPNVENYLLTKEMLDRLLKKGQQSNL